MEAGSTVQARGIYRRASSGNPHPSRERIQRTRAMGVAGAVHFNRDWVFTYGLAVTPRFQSNLSAHTADFPLPRHPSLTLPIP
jgi:hypothetical protein